MREAEKKLSIMFPEAYFDRGRNCWWLMRPGPKGHDDICIGEGTSITAAYKMAYDSLRQVMEGFDNEL